MPSVVGPAAIPVERAAEAVFPVGRVHVGRQVEVVLVQAAEVGDLGDVGAGAGGKLHRQVFEDRLVGHHVHDHVDAFVLGLEAGEHVVIDFALVAVGVAHEPDFLRRCGACQKRESRLLPPWWRQD
jgi:hypothetical protein